MAPPKTATRTLYNNHNNNNNNMSKTPFLTDNDTFYHTQNQHYLTIEELRSERNSCWLCGCNWQQDHVSLDCPECDGYALSRPCPQCEGECKQVWRREINSTHDRHRASWVGYCDKQKQHQQQQEHNNKNTNGQQQQQQQHNKKSTNTTGELKEIYIMALVR